MTDERTNKLLRFCDESVPSVTWAHAIEEEEEEEEYSEKEGKNVFVPCTRASDSWDSRQILEIFASAGLEVALKDNPWKHPHKPIACPYKGEHRQIHPEVCAWHLEEKDPHCAGCPRAPIPVVEPKLEQQQKMFSAIRR